MNLKKQILIQSIKEFDHFAKKLESTKFSKIKLKRIKFDMLKKLCALKIIHSNTYI